MLTNIAGLVAAYYTGIPDYHPGHSSNKNCGVKPFRKIEPDSMEVDEMTKTDHHKMEHSMRNKPMHDMGGMDHHTMIADFKKRFYVVFALTVPVMLLSPMIQQFMGVNWQFAGSSYILFALSTIIFFMEAGHF